jgi:hypothetical protein
MSPVVEAALERARAADILDVATKRLGARLRKSGRWWIGPCPLRCAKDDGFIVNPAKGVFFCRPSGAKGDVIELVRHVIDPDLVKALEFITGHEVKEAQEAPEPELDLEEEAAKARSLWRRRRKVTGSVAETYLRQARGYYGPIPETLGFLPATGKHPPSLIAAFALEHDVRGAHLTRLLPDGSDRIGKVTIGRGSMGWPIALFPPNDLMGLAIAEGIEDGLSIHAATGLGVWAAGAANRMPALADAVPRFAVVTIVGDDDPAGRRGARELALRLKARGVEVALKFLEAAHGQD